MARINPRLGPPLQPRKSIVLSIALLSACAAAPEKKPSALPLPAYQPPAELLESASRFTTKDQALGYQFFSDLLKVSRIPLANLVAVPVNNGGVFIGVAQKPQGYETPFFPLKDFEEQIKPHAKPFQKFYETLAIELQQENYSSPDTPKYKTRCFVLPLFRGTSLDKVSMQGFVFAFELRTPDSPEEIPKGLRPRRYAFEDLIQNYLDTNHILPAQVLIHGRGNAELEEVLNQIFEKKK